VGGERIALSRYAANATLREIRVAIGESALGHKHDLAVRRKMESRHETAHPRTDNEIIAIYDPHRDTLI
jgi:hypothetical protein